MLKFVQSCKLFRSPKHKGLNSPSYTCFCNYIFSTIVITVTWVNFIPPFQWISPIAFVFRKTPQLNELATKALSFEFKSVENMNLKFPIILLQHTWNYTLTFRFMFTNKIARPSLQCYQNQRLKFVQFFARPSLFSKRKLFLCRLQFYHLFFYSNILLLIIS